MLRSTRGGKSTAKKKPLSDISNGRKPLRSRKKEKAPAGDGSDGALDLLLLVRSDLSDLINQVDKLAAETLHCKTAAKKGTQEIESFRHALSDMHSSLKSWSLRLQQAFASTSPISENQSESNLDSCPVSSAAAAGDGNVVAKNETLPDLDVIVSPSPLVSWRAGACRVGNERQLFLLTPLPTPKIRSCKYMTSSKRVVEILASKDENNPHQLPESLINPTNHVDLLQCVKAKDVTSDVLKPLVTSHFSPVRFSNQKSRRTSVLLLTPCLRTSALKPISKPSSNKEINVFEATQDNKISGHFDELLMEEVSQSLASKYKELFQFQPALNTVGARRREVDGTLEWFLSPPKTCVLMEPPNEKPLQTPPTNSRASLLGTSGWNNFESTIRTNGKKPGEETLKKELWTKFDAVSTNELHFDKTVFERTTRKGFLDMLEEVSSENASSFSVAR
ncbi:uncharacterized protein LOC109717000 [Ananas comosus]|uniref:Uncharacterized protein LOC109717000 n=1 Tax=Ananas comosus TaxID=4615 RepID=A0A6P5FRB2_ANACO|nr:uncharacterized protein LOC109717000 [Ananas comosus]